MYATRPELVAYAADSPVTLPEAEAQDRLLQRASFDVDFYAGAWAYEANGMKFGDPAGTNEKALEPWQVQALSRATCAQAEYRLEMGERFFLQGQYARLEGPDFSRYGQLPYIGPKAQRELAGTGLVVTVGDVVSVPIIGPGLET